MRTGLGFAVLLAGLAAGSTESIAASSSQLELDGLAFSVATDKHFYEVGEPIQVQLRWVNVSKKQLLIPVWNDTSMGATGTTRHDDGDRSRAFEVYGPEGKRLPYIGVIGCGPSSRWTLRPNESHDSRYSITDSYDLSRPGTYLIRVTFVSYALPHISPDIWDGVLEHPDVQFEVHE